MTRPSDPVFEGSNPHVMNDERSPAQRIAQQLHSQLAGGRFGGTRDHQRRALRKQSDPKRPRPRLVVRSIWLREVGFKPHWFASQPNQHWQLWLGDEIGIELSFGRDKPQPWWFCWLRTNGEHTPEKSIHIRYVSSKHEVITLVQALTGRRWNPKTHINGSVQKPRFVRKERG